MKNDTSTALRRLADAIDRASLDWSDILYVTAMSTGSMLIGLRGPGCLGTICQRFGIDDDDVRLTRCGNSSQITATGGGIEWTVSVPRPSIPDEPARKASTNESLVHA